MNTLRRRVARPTLATAGLAVALLALTACGGGASASSETTAAAPAATTSPAPQPSGDSNADAGSQNAGPGGDFREAIETYRTCLTDNGVTMPSFDPGQGGPGGGPDGGTPPSGMPTAMPSGMPMDMPDGGRFPIGGFNQKPDDVDQATWDAAVAACADVAPSFDPGQGGPGGPGGGQPDETALAAFKNCVTDNGVTVADDDNWFRELDRNDATVAAAIEKCSPLLPQPSDAGASS